VRTVGYGLLGVYRHKRQNVGPFSVVNLPYWGLMGIGICSGLYHATMKYHTQMGLSNYIVLST
jgi:dihydroceramidase